MLVRSHRQDYSGLRETFGSSGVGCTLATNTHANYHLKPDRFITYIVHAASHGGENKIILSISLEPLA